MVFVCCSRFRFGLFGFEGLGNGKLAGPGPGTSWLHEETITNDNRGLFRIPTRNRRVIQIISVGDASPFDNRVVRASRITEIRLQQASLGSPEADQLVLVGSEVQGIRSLANLTNERDSEIRRDVVFNEEASAGSITLGAIIPRSTAVCVRGERDTRPTDNSRIIRDGSEERLNLRIGLNQLIAGQRVFPGRARDIVVADNV